ncbi:hypothetical protein ACWERV_16935 [Streptomyces sp. NPDC004031]
MSNETPAPAPARPWIRQKTTIAGIVLLVFLGWSLAANRWTDRGCDAIPQSYTLVITHFGTPGEGQGCESEPGGPAYTDDYND